MKNIPLNGKYGVGKFIILDDADFALCSSRPWYANTYGRPKSRINGKDTFLSRFLMNAPRGMVVDHINGNVLDNRRENLRVATYSENNVNRDRWVKKRISCFKGVHKRPGENRWYAQVGHRCIGTFSSEREAAVAYNKVVKKEFGEFAKPNKV